MRFVPLLSSALDPQPWAAFRDVELFWDAPLHPAWTRVAGIHALHFPQRPWGGALLEGVREALCAGLGPDFLVFQAAAPRDRVETTAILGTLEVLLEMLRGRLTKIALSPEPEEAAALVKLLKAHRGEAVGYCWHEGLGPGELDVLSDRLFCAVATEAGDLRPLQRLGYRWNVAMGQGDPLEAGRCMDRMARAYPGVLFPEVLS